MEGEQHSEGTGQHSEGTGQPESGAQRVETSGHQNVGASETGQNGAGHAAGINTKYQKYSLKIL